MMKQIATAGNTVVPALLVLERLGFTVFIEKAGGAGIIRAIRGDETYIAEDPVAVLGLVKLVEMRGWEWSSDDREIEAVLQRYELK